MIVELDLFSGRPNPRWELDDRSATALRRLQSTLRPADRAPAEPPGLGYRGFSYVDGAESGRAYKGYVRTRRAVLADPGFKVERFLLDTLPSDFAGLRQRIAPELR